MKKRSIMLALCCCLVCSPVWAKTFVGVLYPLFGPVAAVGLVELAAELRSMPNVEVATYLHQSWPSLVDDINRQPKGTHIVVVGYSLGANNSVLVANSVDHIDSIIALQPSMFTSNPSVTGKVGRIIEIYNPNPWMTFGGMGSQKIVGPNVEYIANSDSHPGAQFNSDFRDLVKSEVTRLSSEDNLRTARAERPKQLQSAKPAEPFESPKVEMVKQDQDQSKRRLAASTAILDALSSSLDSGNLSVERRLTIDDMKNYAKRTYQDLHTTDLTMASD